MNFNWSNICIYQLLVVLSSNALGIVPAEQSVIKQNDTTSTITKYYNYQTGGLPNDDALLKESENLSTLLKNFKLDELFNQEPGNKKVHKYRIHIKRKFSKSRRPAKTTEGHKKITTAVDVQSNETDENLAHSSESDIRYQEPIVLNSYKEIVSSAPLAISSEGSYEVQNKEKSIQQEGQKNNTSKIVLEDSNDMSSEVEPNESLISNINKETVLLKKDFNNVTDALRNKENDFIVTAIDNGDDKIIKSIQHTEVNRVKNNFTELQQGAKESEDLDFLEIEKLAYKCPECFKRIHAYLLQKEQMGQIELNELSTLQFFKDLAFIADARETAETDLIQNTDRQNISFQHINEYNTDLPTGHVKAGQISHYINNKKAQVPIVDTDQLLPHVVSSAINVKGIKLSDLTSKQISPEMILTRNKDNNQEEALDFTINVRQNPITFPSLINEGRFEYANLPSGQVSHDNKNTLDEGTMQENAVVSSVNVHQEHEPRPQKVSDSINKGEIRCIVLPGGETSKKSTHNGHVDTLRHLPGGEINQDPKCAQATNSHQKQTLYEHSNQKETQGHSPNINQEQLHLISDSINEGRQNIFSYDEKFKQGQASIPSGHIYLKQTHEFPSHIDQKIHTSIDTNQNSTNVLNLNVLDSGDDFSSNLYEEPIPNKHLFAVETLRELIVILQRRLKTQNDLQISNFLKMINLIMVVFQSEAKESVSGESSSFSQLPSTERYYLIRYVHNLVRRRWVQELMLELHKSAYNLNVIQQKKWASHLNSWSNEINYDFNRFLDVPIVGQRTKQPQRHVGTVLSIRKPYSQLSQVYSSIRPAKTPILFSKLLRTVILRSNTA